MSKTTVEELLDLNERIVKANEELIRVNENAMRIIGNLVELLKQSRGSEVRTLSKQDRPSDTCDGYHDGVFTIGCERRERKNNADTSD